MYVGSGEWPVRLRVLGPTEIAPGTTGNVRMFFGEPLPLLPGDRFILREFGRDETVGGGQILDVDPQLKASESVPDRSVDRVIAERGWVGVDELEKLTGERRDPIVGSWVALPATVDELRNELRDRVEQAGPLGLDVALLDDRQRLLLETMAEFHVADGRSRAIDQADVLADHPLIEQLEAEPFAPPDPGDVSKEELRALVQRGQVVQIDGLFFAASAIDLAARRVAELLRTAPDGVTVAAIRDALGTTRKYVLPLLAQLDSTGVTRRRGDLRVGGPRLPDSPSPTDGKAP